MFFGDLTTRQTSLFQVNLEERGSLEFQCKSMQERNDLNTKIRVTLDPPRIRLHRSEKTIEKRRLLSNHSWRSWRNFISWQLRPDMTELLFFQQDRRVRRCPGNHVASIVVTVYRAGNYFMGKSRYPRALRRLNHASRSHCQTRTPS